LNPVLGAPKGSPLSITASIAIREMMFDSAPPGREFGEFVRIGLYIDRVLFACYLPLAAVLLYLAQ